MPRKRDYKHEYELQKKRGEHDNRMERQRARRKIDKDDTGTMTKKSPRRRGKDVSHKKMMMDGGDNSDGVSLMTPSKNRSNNGGARRKPGGGPKRK